MKWHFGRARLMASLSPGLLRARKAELVEFWVVSFDLKVEGTAAARNSRRTVVKGRTGYLTGKSRRNLPVIARHVWTLKYDKSLQLARTPISPGRIFEQTR